MKTDHVRHDLAARPAGKFQFVFLLYSGQLKPVRKNPPDAARQGDNGSFIAYRYLAVLTLTPGPMVEATVQERIY